MTLRSFALTLALLALALILGVTVLAGDLSAPPACQEAAPQPARAFESAAGPATAPITGVVDVRTVAPATLDPHWMYSTNSSLVAAQIYETLVTYGREDPDLIVPQLASAWQISPDLQTYVFTIRSGIPFHEGGTLEAHDVAYSIWRGLLQDRAGGPAWMLFWPLLGVNTVDDLPGDDTAKCQAVQNAVTFDDGAATVTFHLDAPFSPLLQVLTNDTYGVVDQEWIAARGGWGGGCGDWRDYYNPPAADSILYDQANGTGPFRFDSWTADELVLVRHDGYWRTEPAWHQGPSGPAALEMVQLKFESDWETRRDMLLDAGADLGVVDRDKIDDLEPHVWGVHEGLEDPAPTLVNTRTGTLRLYKDLPRASQTPILFFYEISTDTNPYIGSGVLDGNGIPSDFFTDLHVRKAFNYAMDWTEVISDAYQGEAVQSRGPIPLGSLGYSAAQPTYFHSPTLSTQEFQQAWAGQVWSQGFSVTLMYNEENAARKRIVEVLADNIEAITDVFHVNVISRPWEVFLDAARDRRLPMYPGGWNEDYHHPHNWVQPFLHSQGSFNEYQRFPPALATLFDAKVDECYGLVDEAAAQTCYEELQDMSYQQAAAIWGVQPSERRYVRTQLRGYYYHPARPPYYYAFSKGLPPALATVSETVGATFHFSHTSGATTTLEVPAGAVREPTVIVFTPDIVVSEKRPGGLRPAGVTFDLQVCQEGNCHEDFAFDLPVTITVRYDQDELAGLNEDKLYLYTWDGAEWVDAVTECGWPRTAYQRYPDDDTLVVPLCHFTEFALVGRQHGAYLPLVVRKH